MGRERISRAKVIRAKERLVENQLKYGGKKPKVLRNQNEESKWTHCRIVSVYTKRRKIRKRRGA